MKLDQLKNKRILILGLGKEGIDALKFFKKKFPTNLIAGADKNEKIKNKVTRVKYYLGNKYLDSIKNYDVVIKSPGIPLHVIKPLIKKNQHITSSTDIFLNNCQGLVIGVTGTKGKSTICTTIHNILKSGGYKSNLIGNIGKPTLKHLLKNDPSEIYVYELSSFQLAVATKSPDIAIILNIFKDHLDHHRNFKEYINSKGRIFKFQKKSDFLIYNRKDKIVRNLAKKAESQKISFTLENNNSELFKIIGDLFQISDRETREGIGKTKPLPHRMEFVGKCQNIFFYNDSAATIPEATIKAIGKLNPRIDTIIVGGLDKGFNLSELIKSISKSNIKNIVYFPDTGITISQEISRKELFPAQNMKSAVSIAFQKTKKGKICLLSPGAASFNMFKNYKERGNYFKKYVKNEEKQRR